MQPKKVNEGSSQAYVNQFQIEFNQRGEPFFFFIQSAEKLFWIFSNNEKNTVIIPCWTFLQAGKTTQLLDFSDGPLSPKQN